MVWCTQFTDLPKHFLPERSSGWFKHQGWIRSRRKCKVSQRRLPMLRWTIVTVLCYCCPWCFWRTKEQRLSRLIVYCVRMDVINLTTKQTKKIDNQTADQAHCESWEKEAVVVVVVVFLVVVVAFVVVVDDDVFLMLLLSLLIAVITIPNVRLVVRDGRRRPPPRTPQPIISKTRSWLFMSWWSCAPWELSNNGHNLPTYILEDRAPPDCGINDHDESCVVTYLPIEDVCQIHLKVNFWTCAISSGEEPSEENPINWVSLRCLHWGPV